MNKQEIAGALKKKFTFLHAGHLNDVVDYVVENTSNISTMNYEDFTLQLDTLLTNEDVAPVINSARLSASMPDHETKIEFLCMVPITGTDIVRTIFTSAPYKDDDVAYEELSDFIAACKGKEFVGFIATLSDAVNFTLYD